MLNPAANAATAVRMSRNGTNWSAVDNRGECASATAVMRQP